MKRHALFVGVNEYEDSQIRNLNYSLSDAHALKTLFELFGYRTDVLENPDKSDVFRAVKEMTDGLSAGDLFFFYFAGHGWTTASGKHLLFCSDDQYEYLRYDYNVGIPFDFLKKLTEFGGYNRAFVLDACRSDFMAGTRGDDTTTRDLRPIGELVSDAPAKSSLAVLRSCSQYEHALEIDSRKHGLFTLAMMDVLRLSREDGAELLFGESLCDAITDKMLYIANEEGIAAAQTPEFAKSGAAQVLVSGRKGVVPTPDYGESERKGSVSVEPSTASVAAGGKKAPCDEWQRREAELRAALEAERLAVEKAEREAKDAESAAIAKMEAERKAREEAAERERKEAEWQAKLAEVRKAREEAERKARKAREEAERKLREEAERKAREEAECKAREAAERKAREEQRRIREQIERNWREEGGYKAGTTKTLTLPGGAEMEMIYCPPGEFMMGSPTTEAERRDDETQHRVILTKGFWLGKYPVTQRQWKGVMGNNPSCFQLSWWQVLGDKRDDNPVEQVSWNDCRCFIDKVKSSVKQQLGGEARFPTEAEWEYACRAGTTTACSFGNVLNGDKANCEGHYFLGYHGYGMRLKGKHLRKTTPVGKYGANPWGLCDMHGNVWEWCADWYGDYPTGSVSDPQGPASGENRVLRGGGWDGDARFCRSAYRCGNFPGYRFSSYGFRLCCSVGPRGQGAEP